MLLLIVGPCGVGKSECQKHFIGKTIAGIRTKQFKTCTTRQPRPNETEQDINLVPYHFLTREEFIQGINENLFFEFYELNKGDHYDYYGTRMSDLQEAVSSDILNIAVLDPEGAVKVKALFPSAKVVFLIPPSITELFRRAINRNTDPIETILARIERSELEELSYQDRFDAKILNDDLDKCFDEISSFIEENFTNQNNN